jgi:ubiquinone biosynthesis protein COQ4
MKSIKTVFRVISAGFFLISGAFVLIFNRNNYKPIYRGLRYFLDHESYQISLKILLNDPSTRELIDTRYLQNQPTDWNKLKNLPEDTLGFQFAKFMNHPDVTPLNRLPESRVEISPEIDYLRQRIRLIHDIHHVVCDYPATEIGEMAISAFYVAQINSPLNSMLLAFGLIKCTLKTPSRMPELMNAITHGWQLGLKTPNLFGIKWEDLYHLPVSEVRKKLNIQVA